MATDNILSLLLAERDKLTAAIKALQGPTKPRGRQLPAIESDTTKPKKRHVSAASRRKMAAAQKKRWAAVAAAKKAAKKRRSRGELVYLVRTLPVVLAIYQRCRASGV